jgi:Family of unknown function (DUF5681)
MALDHLKPYQFPNGKSGNPGGRPKGLERTAREAIATRSYAAKDGKTYTGEEAAFQCLLDMFFDEKTPGRERIAAFKEWCDRGYGKAKQQVKVTGENAAVAQMPRDVAEMSDGEVREALSAIGTLKRLAVVRGDTEH